MDERNKKIEMLKSWIEDVNQNINNIDVYQFADLEKEIIFVKQLEKQAYELLLRKLEKGEVK